MIRVYRIYIIGKYTPVVQSQVTNWLELIPNNKVESIIISFVYKKQDLATSEQISRFIEHTKVKYEQYVLNKVFNVFNLQAFLRILLVYKVLHKQSSNIVIQFRNSSYGVLFPLLKNLHGVKLIYESRASGVIEFSEYRKDIHYKDKLKYLLMKQNEKLSVTYANRIICVSEKMKEYYRNTYHIPLIVDFCVIPGSADSRNFNFNASKRELLRRKHNINERIVFLYSGGIDHPWQIHDILFTFFQRVSENIEQSYFIVLTRQTKLAKSLFHKYEISPEKYQTEFVSPSKLNDFQNIADFGLLFRENKLTNNTASPTKFAEYLLSGLPVIITKGIGDYSEYVLKNNCGLCYSIDELLNKDIFEMLRRNYTEFERTSISKQAYTTFSKQSVLNKLITALRFDSSN